jgi:dUTP pyrophosphatase
MFVGLNNNLRYTNKMSESSKNCYKLIFKALDAELYSGFAKEYSNENAGIDLYCREDMEIGAGEMAFLKLGICAKLIGSHYTSKSYHYWLLPRSSISKKGLIMANSVGVIDKSYRGELMGAVVNMRKEPVQVKRGERLFQIVAPDMGWICSANEVDELDETVRSSGGFGSSGI